MLHSSLSRVEHSFDHCLKSLTSIDDPTENFREIVEEFRNKTYINNPEKFAIQITDSAQRITEE